MVKKINSKLNKLFKYYSLINHNFIYDNKSIKINGFNIFIRIYITPIYVYNI